MSTAPPTATTALAEAVTEELIDLWRDLEQAVDTSVQGDWSPRCESLTGRIAALTLHVGATDWRDVPIPLLESGVYTSLHARLGVPAPIDTARVADLAAEARARRPLGPLEYTLLAAAATGRIVELTPLNAEALWGLSMRGLLYLAGPQPFRVRAAGARYLAMGPPPALP